jgi:hypothetical protein
MERKQGGRILIPLRLDEGLGEAEQPWGAEIREGREVYGFSNQENRQAGLRGLLDELRSMPGR